MTPRSSRSPQCLIRPAQIGDRKAIEQLVDKFYRSLKPGRARWLRPLYLPELERDRNRCVSLARADTAWVPTNAVPISIRVNLGLDRYKDANIQALVFKPGSTTGFTNLDQRIVP